MAAALVTQIAYAVQTLFDPAGTAGRLVDLGKLANYGLLGGSAPTVWLPSELFTGSTTGVWYDPSDFTTLFQDAAGTTPVTAVEQPVGRMLDKSGRGNHAFQSASANRPTLSARYNLLTGTESLNTQTVTTQSTSYKLTFSGTGTIALSGSFVLAAVTAGTYTFSATAGSLVVTVVGSVTQADLRVANDALNQPAYQRVNTSSDYDTVGFKPYLRFNGVSQWLDTNNTAPLVTQPSTIFAGFTVDASPSSQVIYGGQAAGAEQLMFFSSSGQMTAFAGVNYNTQQQLNKNYVTTHLFNGASSLQRVNTSESIGSFGTQSLGKLRIGSYFNNTSALNGRLYQLVIAGKQASASEITNTETFINQKTGAY